MLKSYEHDEIKISLSPAPELDEFKSDKSRQSRRVQSILKRGSLCPLLKCGPNSTPTNLDVKIVEESKSSMK